MLALLKMIPIIAFAGNVASKNDNVKSKYNHYINLAKAVVTQTEINSLAKMIYVDSLSDEYLEEKDFSSFIKKNMQVQKGITRDLSVDMFGMTYKYTKDEGGFTVYSAGPDLKYDTDDDIYSGYEF
ncbi:MAG: hypothetical protein HOI53_04720 [Francisellaceae bacterium]|jgi:hypothetical protein|nr:hypothetical protein [Francisellaceae bacterium]